MWSFSPDLLSRVRAAIGTRSQWRAEEDDDFGEPDAGVREPRRGSPNGRSSAVALVEPEEESADVEAVGVAQRLTRY